MPPPGLTRKVVFAAVLASALAAVDGSADGKTAIEVLREAPKPNFRPGHTLPRLARWGWILTPEARIELAEHWGYALEMGEANAGLVKQLDDPASPASKLLALARQDPNRYPLCVLVYRACLDKEFLASLPPETWCRGPEGNSAEGQSFTLWSPEAPASVFERAAAEAVAPLKQVLARAPGAIILNGGEYALTVYGHARKVWEIDPTVVKARGDRPWFDYISACKARQELPIAEAVRRACPDRGLYIYYFVDGSPHRNRYDGWWTWAWDYRPLRRISDLPSGSLYYLHYNSGWTGDNDLLTQALNSVGQQIAAGDPLAYNWVNGGWPRQDLGDKAFSDPARYMGFLKCYYATGMLGGIAGYFAYPEGGFAGHVGPEPNNWLVQMITLARVHALFSHVEDLLRDGDLLPGPDRHVWSKDHPAYEFPTGDATTRVLVRKHRRRTEWLVTAWAADGPDREVSVTVPGLGAVRVEATSTGSVYRAVGRDGKAALTRVDQPGLLPTARR